MNAELKNLLVQRPGHIGLESTVIPGFLKRFANVVNISPDLNLRFINRQLKRIGWNDIELDYYTIELARICLEAEGVTALVFKPSNWFEKAFLTP